MGSQVLRLPESAGLILNFHFGTTLPRSADAVGVLAGKECPSVCAFRGVTEYISAAQSIGCDLMKGRQGISVHAGEAHDGGAVAGAFESDGNARPLHYALLSSRRLGKQVFGGYGG